MADKERVVSDSFWFALPGIIGAVISGYIAVRQQRQEKTLQRIKHLTNSLKDELVAKTDTEAHARGVLDERNRNVQEGG